MASIREIPWPRILAEGIAIVVSILLAFLIQAWWEGRQSSDDERVVLEALYIDLNQKKLRLVQDQRLSETIIETGTKLLAATGDTESSLDQESLDELIGNLLWYNPESNWDSAPMNSLLMGGDMSLIGNTTLIQKLASLQVTMNRARLIMRVDANFHENRLMPYLAENADLVQIFLTLGSSPSGTEGEYSFPISRIRNLEIIVICYQEMISEEW